MVRCEYFQGTVVSVSASAYGPNSNLAQFTVFDGKQKRTFAINGDGAGGAVELKAKLVAAAVGTPLIVRVTTYPKPGEVPDFANVIDAYTKAPSVPQVCVP